MRKLKRKTNIPHWERKVMGVVVVVAVTMTMVKTTKTEYNADHHNTSNRGNTSSNQANKSRILNI